MANIWLDRENAVSMPPQSAKKNGVGLLSVPSSAKRSTKKNVLGNIYNTIHNKQSASTPLHGIKHHMPDIFPSATKSLHSDVLRNQQHKLNFREPQKSLEQNIKSATALTTSTLPANDNDDLFYYMDFPQSFCAKNCNKGLSEIWSQSLTFKDSTIKELVNSFPESSNIDLDEVANKSNELKSASYADGDNDDFKEFEEFFSQATDHDDDFNTSLTLPPLPDLDYSF